MIPVRFGSLLAIALVAAGLVVPSAGPAAANTSPQPACLRPYSWVAGTVDLCRGSLVYHDYVYDDYGADQGEYLTAGSGYLAPTAGEGRYPDDAVNTADLVRLTLTPATGRLLIEAELNALFRRESTVLAVAVDTDANPQTGGGTWGELDVASTGWDVIAFLDHGDPRTNTIRGSIPLPTGRTWRVQAVTAQAATGAVMNVAFRGVDERARFGGPDPSNVTDSSVGAWFEDNQARALADGDISAFGATVRVADLTRRVTRLQKVGPGLHERVYTSGFTLPPGEGMTYEGVPGRGDGGQEVKTGFEQLFHHLGRFQPYGIYIPHTPGPWGTQYVFHGTGAVHSSLINQEGMQTEFGENLDRVLVVPLVRGPDGYASDISERDVLDVMADVERTYPIDRARQFASGYSQGGYIAYRMAMLYPQRWAGVVSWVGFTGKTGNGLPAGGGPLDYTAGGVGNVIELVPNLRWVPTTMLASGADYLVHPWTTAGMNRAFAASDNVYDWFFYPAAEHLTYVLLDDWSAEAATTKNLRLVTNPSRVTYRTAEFLGSPKYGIRHDRAYWVSGIRGRGEGFIDIDLTTHGCGAVTPVTETGQDAGVATLAYVRDYRHVVGAERHAPKAMLEGTVANVSAAIIDVRASCLKGRDIAYDVTTDGPATIRLNDGRLLKLTGSGRQRGSVPAAPR